MHSETLLVGPAAEPYRRTIQRLVFAIGQVLLHRSMAVRRVRPGEVAEINSTAWKRRLAALDAQRDGVVAWHRDAEPILPGIQGRTVPKVLHGQNLGFEPKVLRDHRDVGAGFAPIPEYDGACPARRQWLGQNLYLSVATDERGLETKRVLVQSNHVTFGENGARFLGHQRQVVPSEQRGSKDRPH